MDTIETMTRIDSGAFDEAFGYLYSEKAQEQRARYKNAALQFETLCGAGREIRLFSAPGRTEVGGNHTDHQHGRVLAAGVNLDVIAVASKNDDRIIRIKSEGFPMDVVDLSDLSARDDEPNTAAALIRGVAARLAAMGHPVAGFDAYTTSNVLKGSGLSSSAAFETIVGTMLGSLYADGAVDAIQIAQIGQYAENVYFGKPSGLMDQMACSVGGFITIDFADPEKPVVEKVDFDFARSGYKLCIVDTGGNHADLTDDYASAAVEMCSVARALGKEVLRDIAPETFYGRVASLRGKCTDRALLRAFHFYGDNARVPRQVAALRAGDFETFKALVIESGRSSFMYLQNVYTCKNPDEQGLSLALAMSEHLLAGRGAWRVHGGGFAGTIQSFVPDDLLEAYRERMESVFGAGSCHVLSIRPVGGVEITPKLGA